ncbi:MAG: hypothetical protein ACNI27_11150 [Desulfovibrio sp.]
MGFLDLFTGGAGGVLGTIADTVKDYFPPNMSEAEKAKLEMQIRDAAHKKEKELMELAAQADAEVTRRAALLEGSAEDLKSLPFVGRIIIFMRGCQRPVWGFAALYMDWMWFTEWANLTDRQEIALIAINILVLGFLFGERTVKNLMPLFTKLLEAKGFTNGRVEKNS